VAQAYYTNVACYAMSAFVHAKLGEALRDRDVRPPIFARAQEANVRLSKLTRPPKA
jgi:hypothetical protein